MVNDRKKKNETENENTKKPMGGESRPGQAKQTQGSRGKQFEGGRGTSGSSSEPKTSRTGGKSKGQPDTETSTDDDQQ